MYHRVNHRRLRRLLTTMLSMYNNKEYPYNMAHVQPPQFLLPDDFPRDGLTHAFFMFVLCYWMRGGIESDTAILSLARIYKVDHDLFNPFLAQHYNPSHLEDLFKHFGLGFSKRDNSQFWVENAKLLVERWGGDPRNIFADFKKYGEKTKWEVAVNRIKNKGKRGKRGGFAGFREKMVSMLIYFLMEPGLIEKFDFPIPVDFHVARKMVMHKIIELEPGVKYTGGKLDELLDDIRYTSYRYAKRHGITSLVLSNVLWLYSRSMCSENPAFKSKFGEGHGRNKEIIVPLIVWTPQTLRSFARTCGSCQVSDTCVFVVRSSYWYKHGAIVSDPDKQDPTQTQLLSPIESAKTYEGGVPKGAKYRASQNALRPAIHKEGNQDQLVIPFE